MTSAVLLPVADDPSVAFGVWFKVGSQNDPPGKEGLAYLTGQMLSEASTKKNPYDKILEKLYPLASGYGIRVDKKMSTLSGRTHRDNIDKYFDLYTDAFLQPAFTPEDFERLKSDQLNYLKNTLRYASDEELAKAALHAFVFEGTPYQDPPAGTVAGLESITDGEFRRNLWHADFLEQFDGIKVVEGLVPESARHFQSSDSDVQRSPTMGGMVHTFDACVGRLPVRDDFICPNPFACADYRAIFSRRLQDHRSIRPARQILVAEPRLVRTDFFVRVAHN